MLAIGALTFRHEPSAERSYGEIAGHLHPLACIAQRGRTFTAHMLGERRLCAVPAARCLSD